MPVIIFLTKIDEYDPGLLADLTATFHSQRIFDTVQVFVLLLLFLACSFHVHAVAMGLTL